ncbi:MAG TPA: DHA2 family efflux MFS transporter permease subunit [Dehalococcoidia bacterium]|nr:DHA2 family efflux MFS transporter permease subunit [Dehalococcoidia bacterium]
MSRLPYKYIVAITFVVGIFINLLDTTIVNVALPTLQEEFDATTTEIQWVVTGYLVALGVFIPVSGWAGDRLGTKKVYILSLGLFTCASLLCGLAWSIESLILFRVLQGAAGGMITPVGQAMLFRAFPPAERAAAAAILTIPIVVAPASGPIIGGYLVEYQDWPWIFFINVPIGLFGMAIAIFGLREERQAAAGRLDVPGFLLSSVGLGTLLYGLAEAGSRGFDDPRVIVFLLTGVILLASFCIVELRVSQPMVDIRLFGNRLFSAANVVQFLSMGGLQGALFLLPLLLQTTMGLSPLEAGLTTFPQAIGVALMSQPAGRIYPLLGPRRMMMAGMLVITLTTLAFLLVDLETGRGWIMLIQFLRGCGFALTLIPLQAATFATISPEDTGRATAIFNTGRQVAASFGVALLATILAGRLTANDAVLGDPSTAAATVEAFHEAFFAAAVLALVGLAACFLINDKDAASTMVRAREVPAQVPTAPGVPTPGAAELPRAGPGGD